MEYRRHEPPGCGGCLIAGVLLLLFMGGTPLLLNVLGMIFFIIFLLVFVAVAGFWAFGYYIRRQVGRYEQSQTETHNRFVTLLVNILVKIAQIDDTVTRQETETIYNFFRQNLRYSQNQLLWVKELVKDALDSPVTLESLLAEFRNTFAYEPRLILLELVYQVLYTKEHVPDAELEIAGNIAEYLDISPYDQQSILGRYRTRFRQTAADEDRYFEILGLAPGADFAQIKSSYRKMSMQYHPDKVGHLGEEFRSIAEEKMKELNVAYAFLRKKYGQG